MDSDIVTGKPGQDTPSGVFYVWSKQRNAFLYAEERRWQFLCQSGFLLDAD